MLKRHEDQLMSRLEQCVRLQGWCTIQDEELRFWYGKKITKNTWSDIHKKLENVCAQTDRKFEKFIVYRDKNNQNNLITDGGKLKAISDLVD